jgi:hypothetical protein
MMVNAIEIVRSSYATMLERAWLAFYWTSAALIGALVAADAYLWIGPDSGARLINAAICGIVAVVIWLVFASSIYELSNR